MLKLVPILLILSLSACRSGSFYHKSKQCSPVFVYVDETQKLIDVDRSYCSARDYEFSLSRLGGIEGTAVKMPLQYCDRCVGFKDYAETATFWEKVRRSILDNEIIEE